MAGKERAAFSQEGVPMREVRRRDARCLPATAPGGRRPPEATAQRSEMAGPATHGPPRSSLTFCDPDVELLSEPRLKEPLILLRVPMSRPPAPGVGTAAPRRAGRGAAVLAPAASPTKSCPGAQLFCDFCNQP